VLDFGHKQKEEKMAELLDVLMVLAVFAVPLLQTFYPPH
jgi:hypothetical protein